tara:strand:- start:176 stop:691 length:516 start_codon:yes stop_codon:yes gene_type:complete
MIGEIILKTNITMEQKTIWMHYLIIGISIVILSSLNSCSSEIEYKLDTDIIYKNETNYLIRYHQYDPEDNQKVFVFELDANSEKKIEIRGDGGNENQGIDNCCQGILEGFQGNSSILIDYENNDKCLIYINGEGSTTGNISGYTSRTISERYYEFTYTFTEEEYNQAGNCE